MKAISSSLKERGYLHPNQKKKKNLQILYFKQNKAKNKNENFPKKITYTVQESIFPLAQKSCSLKILHL
jgi:hypothetical protein